MAAIQKVSLVDQVYTALRNDIITFRRPLGSKLNVNELQGQLSVSCTPIREAINRLQQEGLVDYKNNIGASILTLAPHDVVEIQQLACALHTAALELSMDYGDRSKIVKELEHYLEAYRCAASPAEQVNAIFNFMGVFYHNCGNARLDQAMIGIQGQQLLLRNLYATHSSDVETQYGYYVEILDNVRRDNFAGARAALRESISRMTEELKSVVSAME